MIQVSNFNSNQNQLSPNGSWIRNGRLQFETDRLEKENDRLKDEFLRLTIQHARLTQMTTNEPKSLYISPVISIIE